MEDKTKNPLVSLWRFAEGADVGEEDERVKKEHGEGSVQVLFTGASCAAQSWSTARAASVRAMVVGTLVCGRRFFKRA